MGNKVKLITMDSLITLLNNNWVSGILTGLVGTAIIGGFNKFRENKEYKKRIELATYELADTIEAFIPEEEMPKGEILHSIYNSIAKKNLVNTKDMPSFSSTIDYLIFQVMKSNYLAYHIKTTKCQQLHDLKIEIDVVESKTQDVGLLDKEIEVIRERAKGNLITSSVIMLGIVTLLITTFLNIFSKYNKEIVGSIFLTDSSTNFTSSITITTFTIAMMILLLYFMRRAEKELKKRRELIRKRDEFNN